MEKRKNLEKKSKKSSNKKKLEKIQVIELPAAKTKQKKAKRIEKVADSDEEYELPNPAFECPDENVEQAMSASFIEFYEKKQQNKISECSEKLMDKTSKKKVATKKSQNESKSEEKSVVVKKERAAKRKSNNENNDDTVAKKLRATETNRTSGKRRQRDTFDVQSFGTKIKQQKQENIKVEPGKIEVEVAKIKVEPGTVNKIEGMKQRQNVVKKHKVTTVEDDNSQTKESKSDDNTSKTEGQVLLSLGNMPNGCNKEALNFFFNESDLYPQISLKKKSVTIENEKGEKRRRNVIKGSATLICKSQAEADAILKLNGVTMTSVTGEESEISISLKQSVNPLENATKLFIGSLHPKIPEVELQEALEDEGISLVKVKRARWKGGKRPKGYGFVWVPTQEDVKKAMEAKIMMEGKQLVITQCKS